MPVFVFAYNLGFVVAYAPGVFSLLSQGAIGWTATGIGFVLPSGLLHLCYSLCLPRGYRVADLSNVYPVARGTGPMPSTIGALSILGEVQAARGLLASIVAVNPVCARDVMRGHWRLVGCAVLVAGVLALAGA